MKDHISALEAQLSTLVSMDSNVSESMKVALLLSSLFNLTDYCSINASVNTFQQELTTWNYVSALFIKENKRLSIVEASGSSQNSNSEEENIFHINISADLAAHTDGTIKWKHVPEAVIIMIVWGIQRHTTRRKICT